MTISIITVNRNNREGLHKTIKSVLQQTERPYEFIVIDGASTDGSADLLKEYHEQITYSVSELDTGIYNAMNKGIDVAGGDYCLFLNSGDCFCGPDVISRLQKKAVQADIIVGSAIILEDPPRKKTAPPEITLQTLYNSAICHQSAFIRTSLLKQERYDESLRIVADRKFFLNNLIIKGCSYEAVDVDIVNYDITGFSAQNRLTSELEWEQVLETLIPGRILQDYGRTCFGPLYGTGAYEHMFLEIGKRRWRGPVYRLVRVILSCVAMVRPSARFIRNFPSHDA